MLFLWTVDCHLLEALAVGEAWGFEFKTVAFTWVKLGKDGTQFPIGMNFDLRALVRLKCGATTSIPLSVAIQHACRSISAPFACIG